MDKISKPEILLTLSFIPFFILVFIQHDEGFILFLIELAFIAIIGILYTALVLLIIWISNTIQKLLWRIKHGKEK